MPNVTRTRTSSDAASGGGLVAAETRESQLRQKLRPEGPSSWPAGALRPRFLCPAALVLTIGALSAAPAYAQPSPSPDPYPSARSAPAPDPDPSASSSASSIQPEPEPVAASSVPKIACSGADAARRAAVQRRRHRTRATAVGRRLSSVGRHRLGRRSRTRARRRRHREETGPRPATAPSGRRPRRRRRRIRSPLLRLRRPRLPRASLHWGWRAWRSSRSCWRAAACCSCWRRTRGARA